MHLVQKEIDPDKPEVKQTSRQTNEWADTQNRPTAQNVALCLWHNNKSTTYGGVCALLRFVWS